MAPKKKPGRKGTIVSEAEKEYAFALGRRLDEAMRKSNKKNADLAEALGVHFTTVSNMRVGKNRPNAYYLVEYAKLLGCDVTWLLTGVEGKIRSKSVAPEIMLEVRTDRDMEICWDCGSKEKPVLCADEKQQQFYSCRDCHAESPHVDHKTMDPKTAWNALAKREKFKFEQQCVSSALTSLGSDARNDDAVRAVLIGLEAARLIGE